MSDLPILSADEAQAALGTGELPTMFVMTGRLTAQPTTVPVGEPTEPRPIYGGTHHCLGCGREQTADEARWGQALSGLVEPAWLAWLCAEPTCDLPWLHAVRIDEAGNMLFRPDQLPH